MTSQTGTPCASNCRRSLQPERMVQRFGDDQNGLDGLVGGGLRDEAQALGEEAPGAVALGAGREGADGLEPRVFSRLQTRQGRGDDCDMGAGAVSAPRERRRSAEVRQQKSRSHVSEDRDGEGGGRVREAAGLMTRRVFGRALLSATRAEAVAASESARGGRDIIAHGAAEVSSRARGGSGTIWPWITTGCSRTADPNFFLEFVDLFLPGVSAYLDKDTPAVPMDKELFTDVTLGERHEVDLLMKVKFRGEPAFFLIHVENQATAQADFPKRMFRYFARLSEKYDLPVYPVVIFSYDTPVRPEPKQYRVAFPDKTVLRFDYEVIQLNRLPWRRFVRQANPVASALMAKMKMATRTGPSQDGMPAAAGDLEAGPGPLQADRRVH